MDHAHPSPECRALLAGLSDYLDGTLEQTLCDQLEAHLAGCEDCRLLVDTTRKTVELYGQLGKVDVPATVLDRLWKTLEDNGCL
jgi:predicted anti-sigma-YlaC factor YlaD